MLCGCNVGLRASSKKLGISSKDIPLPICHCKDYLDLPVHDPESSFTDKYAIFKLATRPCSCGSGLEPCNNAAHIKALINIASVYAAQKSNRKAIQYASLAITLAPHLPEGYLRMVTVIRQGEVKCTPDTASRCNWIDTQASHTIRAYGDKNHEMLKVCPASSFLPAASKVRLTNTHSISVVEFEEISYAVCPPRFDK